MSFQTINNLTYLSGTQEDYDNLLTKDDNTLYIITDTRRLYLGDIEYTNNQSFYGNILDTNKFIVTNFPSVSDMEAHFALNDNYTDVQYGEYVIINVPNGGDAQEYADNNGKIFRRGFNGAEYVCRISGPAGEPSILNIKTMSEVDPNNELIQHQASLASDSLVPGKANDTTYNDTIKWKYNHQTVTNADQTNLGFSIPYHTFDFSIETAAIADPQILDISPTNNGHKIHPFHSDIKIQLPQYKYGRSVDNLYIMNAGDNDGVDYGDTDASLVTSYRARHVPILVFLLSEYDEHNNLTSSVKFLSEFKIVDNIDISDMGYLRFWLPYGEQDANQQPMYISSSSPVIPQLTGVDLDTDGTLSLNWNNPLNNTTSTFNLDQKLKWIQSITTTDNGNLIIQWNNGDTDTTSIMNGFALDNLITDLIIYDSILYKRYVGLDQQIITITNVAADQLSAQNDAAINSLAGTTNTYHKDTTSNLWYKKLFDIRTLSNNQSQNNGT